MNACVFGDASRLVPRLTRLLDVAGLSAVTVLTLAACEDPVTPASRVVYLSIQSGDNQAGEVATKLAQPLVVELDGELSRPVEGVLVRFESADRGTQRVTVRSDSLGRAWVWWQLGELARAQSIQAVILEQPVAPAPVTFRAMGLPGQPAKLDIVVGSNLQAAPGTELDTLDVIVSDRFANPTPAAPVNWSIEAGGGAVRPLAERTSDNGRARALWTLGENLGTQSLLVTAGTGTRRLVATALPALVARQITAGSDHSCALTADGTAYCWGSNSAGQLGNGAIDRQSQRLPTAVKTPLTFKSLAAGALHTCGLAQDGATWCWGGDWQVPNATPARLVGAPPFASIAAGAFHTCGLTSAGAAWCWGDNSVGQLGRGVNRSTAERYFGFGQPTPLEIAGSLTFSSIAATSGFTCGVTTGGVAYCWGASDNRALGSDPSQTCRVSQPDDSGELAVWDVRCSTSPIPVLTRTSVSAISLHQHGACAILATSELECWGDQLPGPTLVPGARVSKAWAVESAICGWQANDTVACWAAYPPFMQVHPLGGHALVDIHSSGRHSCGLTRGQEPVAYCWGTNYEGELGDGTIRHREFPVAVVWPYAASNVVRP